MTNAEFIGLLKRYPVRFIAGAIAVASGIGVYLINDRIETATTVLTQKIAEGERLATNVKYSAQLAEQFELLTTAGDAIRARTVLASQLANNLQYFYRLETESGVELIDVRQTTSGVVGARSTIKGPTNGVGFAVILKGTYPSLMGWLRRLEGGRHYCRVLSASIGAAGLDRAGPLTLAVSLELFGQP